MTALGVLAVIFYAIHGVDQILHHHPEDLLWACHVACLFVGVGCLFAPAAARARPGHREASRVTIAIGVSWLSVGIPLWVLDLGTGGAFILTSVLTHVGGFAVGAAALKILGWPRRVWWKAVLVQCVLMLVTRLLTPREANVNLAFSVWQGWERYFPSYSAYFALLFTGSAASFALVEGAMLRFFAPRVPTQGPV